MIEEIERKVQRLEKEIKDAEREEALLEGQKKELLHQLETQFGVKTMKEAEALFNKKIKEVGELNTKLSQQYEELKRNYELE